MTDFLLPPHLRHAKSRFRYIDSTGISRGEFSGIAKTGSRGGDRIGAVIEFTPHGGRTSNGKAERAALISALAGLQGKQNRIYVSDNAHTLRGSFPATELLSNNTFANGTTGWTADSEYAIAVSDRILKTTRIAMTSTARPLCVSSTVTVTQYVPYVWRAMICQGRGSYKTGFNMRAGSSAAGTDYGNSTQTGFGLKTFAFVPYVMTCGVSFADQEASGLTAGDYLLIPYTSLSRCALVDNGPNLLRQSDEFDVTDNWIPTRASIDDQATAAPDATVSADSIIEDTATGTHSVGQSVTVASAVRDYAFTVALKAGTRTWARLFMTEGTGSTMVSVFVNLTTGTLGATSTGANWANLRAYISSLGNGWHKVSLVARKNNAATIISANIGLATGDNTASYAGDGSSNIYAWRATLAASGVPTRLVQTTAAATSGTSQTGNALYLKGLPASIEGLLLPGDWAEVITPTYSSLHMTTAPINSDAAGLGYWQFTPPLRSSPADGAAVIVHQPFGRFLLASDFVEWSNEPGPWTGATFELEEAGV